jgi:hypothetical protein
MGLTHVAVKVRNRDSQDTLPETSSSTQALRIQ